MITIRPEQPEDILGARKINELAFETPAEANIVDKLHKNCTQLLSLVAEEADQLVGHIIFSPVVIESARQKIKGMGLAPMSVLPGYQNQGIGTKLVERGLEILRKQGCPFVIVLGHPEFYPRFGFEPASKYGLSSQWNGVPDEAFMVIVFDEPAMQGINGIARYREEFNDLD